MTSSNDHDYSANRTKKRRPNGNSNSCQSAECIVCMDCFGDPGENGICCPEGHFLCSKDVNSYLKENMFPQVYKLRDRRCAIPCPVVGCHAEYNSLNVYKHLSSRDQFRYKSMISELVLVNDKNLRMLCSSLVDLMTLKCPTCKNPVDPFPDACSAVMCLNCGNHYCNYCFHGFATGKSDQDRAAAHSHTAAHHESDKHGGRDAFLPVELVMRGHQEYRVNQISKCIFIAMTSTEFGINSRHDVALSLILCAQEMEDLGLSIHELWNIADNRCMKSIQMPDPSESASIVSSHDSVVLSQLDLNIESVSPSRRRRGGAQLTNAILTNNSAAISQLIESFRDNLDVDFVDQRHGHPLTTLAILSGHVWAAKLLLEKGADPMKMNKGGRTVLYIAIEAGLDDIVRFIIENFPAIDINNPITEELQRYCPIHVAARNNHGTLVRTLVELNADLDIEESEHGYTPLMLALVLGHEWVAAELIIAGANVRYLASNGRSPMFVAAEKGLSSVISLMVNHCKVNVNEPAVRPSGLRMIHVASFHRQPLIVSQLIRLGANVNQFDDENGYSPLSMAILGLNAAAALELIAAGADVNQPSRSGRKPLYVAIEKGLTDVVKALLSFTDSDVNSPVTSEKNAARPLHVAILYGQHHLIPLLIELGADVNMPDNERRCSPLLMAALLKDAWSVKLLLRSNANACQLSKEGRSAMYIAAEKGFSGILRLLIEDGAGVDINGPVTSEAHRGTALHIAAMFDNAHTIIELISLGANVDALDALGRKAVDVAREMSSSRAEMVLSRQTSYFCAVGSVKVMEVDSNLDLSISIENNHNDDNDQMGSPMGDMSSPHLPLNAVKFSSGRRVNKGAFSPGETSVSGSTPLPRRGSSDRLRKSPLQSPVLIPDSSTTESSSAALPREKRTSRSSNKRSSEDLSAVGNTKASISKVH